MTDKQKNDELAKQYNTMLDVVGKDYKEGFFKWVEAERPDIAKRLVILDERIEEVWGECLKGEATVEKFKASMELYVQTISKTLKLYNPKP